MSLRTSHLLLALVALAPGAPAQEGRTHPDLVAAVADGSERLFDHLVTLPAAAEGTGVVRVAIRRGAPDLDPLRSAALVERLEAELAGRGVRVAGGEGRGSAAAQLDVLVAVCGSREPFRLEVRTEWAGQPTGFSYGVHYAEKPWVRSGPDPSARYPLLFRVRGHGRGALDGEEDPTLGVLRERLSVLLGEDAEVPRSFVARRAPHWELDRFATMVDDGFGGTVRSVTVLYGLTERHLDELRTEVDRAERERFGRWVFRVAWILGALALSALCYVHVDWKTRGYVSGPLKIVCVVLFALVASAGFGLL